MKKVLVGYMISPEGEAALEMGIEQAHLRQAELLVLHSSRGGNTEQEEDIIALEAAAESIQARLEAEGLAFRMGARVLGNSPSTDIIRIAKDEAVDVIVIGIRRRTLAGKIIFGSTALDILTDAPCPVLAVKASREGQDGT